MNEKYIEEMVRNRPPYQTTENEYRKFIAKIISDKEKADLKAIGSYQHIINQRIPTESIRRLKEAIKKAEIE